MFVDERYNCFTVTEVRNEIFGSQKFKTKYPWRNRYKDKIKCLPNSTIINNSRFDQFFDAISTLNDNYTANERIEKLFDLSREDKLLLACALSEKMVITTGDGEIKDFGKQEFSKYYKGSISPLGMVNNWIRSEFINWNSELHEYLSEWNANHEHPQPRKQKKEFKIIFEV